MDSLLWSTYLHKHNQLSFLSELVRVDHGLSVEITHLVLERREIVVFGHRIDTWLATQLPTLGVLKGHCALWASSEASYLSPGTEEGPLGPLCASLYGSVS